MNLVRVSDASIIIMIIIVIAITIIQLIGIVKEKTLNIVSTEIIIIILKFMLRRPMILSLRLLL